MQMSLWFVAKLTGEEQAFPRSTKGLVLPASVLVLGVSRAQEMEGKNGKRKGEEPRMGEN